MAIKKADRIKVYNKYDGRCAYCGKQINYRQMQIDHIRPQKKFYYGLISEIPAYNVHDECNLNPACRRCNIHKYDLSIEEFREMISNKLKVLASSWHYNIAKDFNMVTEQATPVVFYYEKLRCK